MLSILRDCRPAIVAAAIFSGLVNLLMLAGSIYMLQVYDRVLTSRSMATLFALSAVLVAVFVVQAILDIARQHILSRVGAVLDRRLARRVHDMVIDVPLKVGSRVDGTLPSRDLDTVRAFAGSLGPTSFFDLPWLPIYVALCFLLHPTIGFAAVFGCVVLFAITLATEAVTRRPAMVLARELGVRTQATEAARRNAEAVVAMGMRRSLRLRFETINERFLAASTRTADSSASFGVVSKTFRMFMQSAVLGLGAYLVLHELATPGVMIAASILVGRAMAPIDGAVAHWKGFVAARQSWKRLRALLKALPSPPTPMTLPKPTVSLTLENVYTAAPGSTNAIVHGTSLALVGGQALGIIGPSASGKSTLIRTICGAWEPMRGSVRLDNAELRQWPEDDRGGFIGYLPQDVALFAGTVAENIARFTDDADPAAIVRAAVAAGADTMIRSLPDGFETQVGDEGTALSGGQRQRIALARALYGDPFLVVLDEPNANLDAEGEAAVANAITNVRARGGIAVVVAHRPSAIAAVDLVAFMRDGRIQALGPRDDILNKVLTLPPRPVVAGAA